MGLYISNHAVDRFRVRMRLKMPKAVLNSRANIRYKINQLVEDGFVCNMWKMVPFYAQVAMSKHGEFAVVRNKDLIFIMSADLSCVKTMYVNTSGHPPTRLWP
jgi:hypothetical protein